MQQWFSTNIGTILAGLIVLVIVGFVIFGMIKRKRSGKPVIDCGGECSKCGGGCSTPSSAAGTSSKVSSGTNKGMVRTVLTIDGMMCSMCESQMNDYIRNNFDVKHVISSFKKGETVVISKDPLDEDSVRKAVESTGYRVVSFAQETL